MSGLSMQSINQSINQSRRCLQAISSFIDITIKAIFIPLSEPKQAERLFCSPGV